jgi:hypothetical protein
MNWIKEERKLFFFYPFYLEKYEDLSQNVGLCRKQITKLKKVQNSIHIVEY